MILVCIRIYQKFSNYISTLHHIVASSSFFLHSGKMLRREPGAAAARGMKAMTDDAEFWKMAIMEKLRQLMDRARQVSNCFSNGDFLANRAFARLENLPSSTQQLSA